MKKEKKKVLFLKESHDMKIMGRIFTYFEIWRKKIQILLVHIIHIFSCTLHCQNINKGTVWDIPVTQGGSEWWSDKLGYLSVSVPCFSNNCRQSWVIQITFCYKLVLFARHTLELCPCLVLLFRFFSSCFAPFFPVTCCSQLSILAVLLSVSLPGPWHVVAVVQEVIN